MPKGLLLTVGASAESEIFCIRKVAPEWVAFLCTEGSRKTLDRIVNETGLKPSQYHVLEVPDTPTSTGALVMKAHEACRWLEERCGSQADITINPTAGRKWMSMALGLFGSRTAAHQVYVEVKFSNGKPDPGTMELVDLGNAQDHTGLLDAEPAVALFNRNDFAGAASLFERIQPLDARARELYRGLTGIAHALHRWDRFEHYADASTVSKEGASSLAFLKDAARELQLQQLGRFVAQLERLLDRIREVEVSSKPSLAAVVDLVLNARRRITASRLDDGVARLYRALEATAQVLLKQNGIDASRVDWTRIPQEAKQKLSAQWSVAPDGQLPEKLGLVQAFELARALSIPGVERFFNQQARFCYEKHLSTRNESILAHGWKTLDESRACKFADQLQADLEQLGADFRGWTIPEMPRLWS
ncbi:TIGR02710 family CRISPR-associated CARF protein [Fontivita pretiosa]|uniref:TIGR02710 family CRISPR-associated CARF protein n=1 Tax=Fontivita pretiosa TaxID=2989684 RepID=UPI003D18286C